MTDPQHDPSNQPSDQPNWALSEPTRKTVPAFTALVAEARLTVPKIAQFAEQATTQIVHEARAGGIDLIGPATFIYSGTGTGAHDLFRMQVALPVPPGTVYQGDQPLAVLEIPELSCVAFDYVGPLMHIGDAYPICMNAMKEDSLQPREESREVYKHFLAYDHADNITEIQFSV